MNRDILRKSHGESIISLMHCITSYINFCFENKYIYNTAIQMVMVFPKLQNMGVSLSEGSAEGCETPGEEQCHEEAWGAVNMYMGFTETSQVFMWFHLAFAQICIRGTHNI